MTENSLIFKSILFSVVRCFCTGVSIVKNSSESHFCNLYKGLGESDSFAR